MSKYLKLDHISISLSTRVFSFNTEIHEFQISEVPLLWMEDHFKFFKFKNFKF